MSKLAKYETVLDDAFTIIENVANEISNNEHKEICLSRIKDCNVVLALSLKADDDNERSN